MYHELIGQLSGREEDDDGGGVVVGVDGVATSLQQHVKGWQ
jgi:hypothetical protein